MCYESGVNRRGPGEHRDDTSVVVDETARVAIEQVPEEALPGEIAVSAITLAELAAGPHATADAGERARRQDRVQRAEATFDPIPFDPAAARSYRRLYAAVVSAGRKARGRRAIDALIAATALANELPLFTRNPSDFVGLESVLEVVGADTAAAP